MAAEHDRAISQVRKTALLEKSKTESQLKHNYEKQMADTKADADARVKALQVGFIRRYHIQAT